MARTSRARERVFIYCLTRFLGNGQLPNFPSIVYTCT
jgi:hypothetical protein